jgi:hypothetical protein
VITPAHDAVVKLVDEGKLSTSWRDRRRGVLAGEGDQSR